VGPLMGFLFLVFRRLGAQRLVRVVVVVVGWALGRWVLVLGGLVARDPRENRP